MIFTLSKKRNVSHTQTADTQTRSPCLAPALSAGPHGRIKGMPNSSLKVSMFHMALLCLACWSLVRGAGWGEFLLCSTGVGERQPVWVCECVKWQYMGSCAMWICECVLVCFGRTGPRLNLIKHFFKGLGPLHFSRITILNESREVEENSVRRQQQCDIERGSRTGKVADSWK